MQEYVLAAISEGLRKIVFLEHLEDGIRYFQDTWLSEDKFDLYFKEGERLKKLYGHTIEIGLGVECGYNPDAVQSITRRLAQRKWDAVGISCHFLKIDGLPHHLNLFSRNSLNLNLARHIGAERIIDQYLSTLTEAVNRLPGTKVCHLDGALRWCAGIDMAATHPEQIELLLQAVKKRSMSLEINTSGFAIRQMQFPSHPILRRARYYHIPLVLGSDAHRPQDVGQSFAVLSSSLQSHNIL